MALNMHDTPRRQPSVPPATRRAFSVDSTYAYEVCMSCLVAAILLTIMECVHLAYHMPYDSVNASSSITS